MLSMGHLARDIASRLHHRGSYIAEDFVESLAADLREIALIDWSKGKDLFTHRKAEILSTYGYPTTHVDEKPFAFANGVAIIPVHGILLNRFSGSYSFATGYNFIRNQRRLAIDDPDVELIAYDYNTYGGLAAGCGELSKEMFDGRHEKPSIAIVDANCYSAGYNLGSAQDRIVATPSSGVGSIGCVSMHVDLTKMLEQEGVKISVFRSGKEKMNTNPYEPLTDAAKKSIQADIDYHASAFFESVARNRGLDDSDIRAMEGRCFNPTEALENGLIDAVQTPAEAIASFLAAKTGGTDMTTTQGNGGGAPTVTLTEAQLSKMIADGVAAGVASAIPTAIAAHDKAKTERRAAIMGCDEAKKRQKFAAHLADNTTMSADEAKALLAVSAEEQPEKKPGSGRNPFQTAMDGTRNPNVGADDPTNGGGGDDGGGDDGDPNAQANAILGNFTKLSGRKVLPFKKDAA